MSLFDHIEFDNHEQIQYACDPDAGLRAIIAVHDTRLGPSLGGTRMFPYANDDEALTDVLRLSRGMTYKSALARLPLGGGKSVIIGDPARDKSPELLRAFGRAVDRLGGRYIAAEDSGTSVPDMRLIHEATEHVTGFHEKRTAGGDTRSGDPSPVTAEGCFLGIQAAVRHRLNRDDLDGLTVGIQGLGAVGYRLAEKLAAAGAALVVTDVNAAALERARRELDARVVEPEALYAEPMDVFVPSALGATVNPRTLEVLKASVIAGPANNQLDRPETGRLLLERGICYAPDYVINAGGVIDVYYEQSGQYDIDRVNAHIAGIAETLDEIFQRADQERRPTSDLADTLARERLAGAPGPGVRRSA